MFEIKNFIDNSLVDVHFKKKIDKKGKINLSSNEMISSELYMLQKMYQENNNILYSHSYPYYPRIRENISKLFNFDPRNVEFYSGSDSAIFFLLIALAKKSISLVIQYPNYESYFDYSILNNLRIYKWNINEKTKIFDINTLLSLINANKLTNVAVILANPNGFTGKMIDLEEIEFVLKKFNVLNILLIIDLAYLAFSSSTIENIIAKFCSKYRNIILVNTLSKSHGLASERFGYIYADSEFINYIRKWNGINTISGATYDIVRYYMEHTDFIHKIRNKIINNRNKLIEDSNKKILFKKIYESESNFILVEHHNNDEKNKFIDNFYNEGFVIRDLGNIEFLENYSRITIPADEYLSIIHKIMFCS